MAEKKSPRALTGQRILSMPISNYQSTRTATGWAGDKMWEPVGIAGANGICAETYFDLSAYELDDLTLVPQLMQLQDGLPYFSEQTESLEVYDVISQERLNPDDFILYSLGGDYPSSPGSTEDWSQILMCNTRFFAPTNDFQYATLYLPATQGSFGSSEPTAVQKLWVYRIVLVRGGAEGSYLSVPATRFVLGAEIIQEDDLPYMMRLKRSYELSQ
tara:strand:+ start:284 stop:931 length:648 start_codon:yes stop_codon:yes gene_type:complete